MCVYLPIYVRIYVCMYVSRDFKELSQVIIESITCLVSLKSAVGTGRLESQ